MKNLISRIHHRGKLALRVGITTVMTANRFVDVKSPIGRKYVLSLSAAGKDEYHDLVASGRNKDIVWEFISNWVRKGDVFYDLGANIGTLSIAAAVNGACVHSFEMLHENIYHLARSVKTNQIDNISIVHAAVGRSSELVGIAGSSAWGHAADTGTMWVPGTSVDMYSEKRGINHVDLIKIDIEGSEKDALHGAERMIENSHPDIVIESNALTCGGRGYSYRDIINFLDTRGYKIYRLTPSGIIRWDNDWVQEVILTDYLATMKPENEVSTRSRLPIKEYSSQFLIDSIVEQDRYVPWHRQYVRAVQDRLPHPVQQDARVRALLERWGTELGEPPEVLRTGSI